MAGLIRVVVVPAAWLYGSEVLAQERLDPALRFEFPPELNTIRVLVWPAFAAIVFVVAKVQRFGTWQRARTETEVVRGATGISHFMRLSRADYLLDPKRWLRDWDRAETVAEPFVGFLVAALAWQLDAAFGGYIATLVLFLWMDASEWKARRRNDRLTAQESLENAFYERFVFEDARRRHPWFGRSRDRTFRPDLEL